MLIVIFSPDIRCIVHREFVSQVQTVSRCEGERSAEAAGSGEHEELDSLWRQCTLSPSPPRSWVSSPKQLCITSGTTIIRRIYHLWTSVSSATWKCSWKIAVLRPLPRSRANRGNSSTSLRKMTFRISKVAGTLGSVFCCAMWLFRKRWCQNKGKYISFFFKHN